MVIYEPYITEQSLVKNIQDYPVLIKFIQNGGVTVKNKKISEVYGERVGGYCKIKK